MPATPISQPASGESLLGTEPELLQQVDPGWRHRLNLFTGRALTDTALDGEQLYRSGLLTTLAQAVTPGTVSGLALTLDTSAPDPLISVSPGYGIAATGIDVVLNRTLKTPLSTVAVINGIDGGQYAGQSLTLTQYHAASTAQGTTTSSYAGILLLQPVIAQVSGEDLNTGTGPIEVTGNLAASCSTDTSGYAFEDWQIADAVRLVYLPWPTAAAASTSSALSLGLPLPAFTATTLRNRLAYSIFEAEALLGPDDQFPWTMLGVPLALVAFDPTQAWKPTFVDRSSVVRTGGLPRRRHVLPAAPPPLRQWQPLTHFAATDFLIDSNGNLQTVRTAGTSGGPPPKWALTPGSTTPDGTGTLVWNAAGPANWKPNTPVLAGQFLYDDAGNLQYAVAAGATGSAEPDWNAIFLPTPDGTVTWINNGAGTPPLVQAALADARIRQLSEQLSDAMAQGTTITNLTTVASVLPPSGLLPVAAVNFPAHTAPWLPKNWQVTAAPVLLEELEAVIATGLIAAPLSTDPAIVEAVELLVPLPDTLYDPKILVTETVAPVFQQEVDAASAARNLTLQELKAVQTEANSLITGIGPNLLGEMLQLNGDTVGLLNPDAGLTALELISRNTLPPYIPTLAESFGTAFPATWQATTAYAVGDFVFDGKGGIQVVITAGTSFPSPPSWSTTIGKTTSDNLGALTNAGASLVWLNNGPFAWRPNTSYVTGQFIVDSTGTRHFASSGNNTGPGISAEKAPDWSVASVPDGVIWKASGNAGWHSDTVYTVGQLILDSTGNIQIVQTGGLSGDSAPSWTSITGYTTADSTAVWRNLGHAAWQPQTRYTVGQAILDPKGIIQIVTAGGTSGAAPPAWVEGSIPSNATASTVDSSITWNKGNSILWAPSTAYKAGQMVADSSGMLHSAIAAGTSGTTQPTWFNNPQINTPDANMSWLLVTAQSTELQRLAGIAKGPYTITFSYPSPVVTTPPSKISATESLINFGLVPLLGLKSLITLLQEVISRANDLVDMAFLTAQTDIYRFRQNVLGATAATTLATSPVLANIAKGETAGATSENLQAYYQSLYASTPTPGTVTAPGTTGNPIIYYPITFNAATEYAPAYSTTQTASESARSRVVAQTANLVNSRLAPSHASATGAISAATKNVVARSSVNLETVLGVRSAIPASISAVATKATKIINPGVNTAVVSTDITAQSPLVGAQLNLRTLSVAERLQQSASQEAMFYAIANRLSFINSLVALRYMNLNGFVIDDLPIPVDDTSTKPPPEPVGIVSYTVAQFNAPEVTSSDVNFTVASAIKSPWLPQNPPEATLFSVGVRVVEQHTILLRALEARIQQYSDFLTLCTNALNSMQSSLVSARTYIAQLTNRLTTERQNVAFTSALLADETNRVATVNARRQSILATSVQLVVYTRARTLEPFVTTPSRQLVPANVASPVPTCLNQSVSIPPELREIVAQLREAPVAWLPACATLMQKLERSTLLMQLAIATQARAEQQLKLALLPSSAAQQHTVYANSITQVYTANQRIFRSYQVERASFQPASLTNLAWSQQLAALQRAAALNDLISAEAVHAEISNAVARIVQQVSSVATCLYTRVSAALPIDRLAWAEFLRGPGASISLASLSTLPSFNTLSYTDRQQMQLLVDWLFQQIDHSYPAASAFLSDVIRTAILLASDVPLDHIIPTSILQRTQPTVGGLVSLNLASDRVASGMIVNLYSAGTLAARAVVSDHDASTATATVTNVYKPNVHLETTDTAHFTAQIPNAVALRPHFQPN